jgi:23S rRNA (uracil1939-C5)-methyltransferase
MAMRDGYGVGRNKRQEVLVPYTIEGEQITASVTSENDGVTYGEGKTFLAVSADRVLGECEHFGMCWGCQWQHIAYPAQLLMKFDTIAQVLQDVGGFSDELLTRVLQPVIPSPNVWRYNHQATFYRAKDGRYGFPRNLIYRKGFEAIDYCHTVHPSLQNLQESLQIDFEELERYTLIVGSDDSTMMLLNMKSEDMPELEADMPTSVNVLLPDGEPVNLFGDAAVRYRVHNTWFRATAGAFFRANVAQVENLVKEVLFALDLHGHESVLDLYAGVGVFSAFIAPHAEVVTLVESYPPSATDAEENLLAYENVDIVEGTVGEILDSMLETEAHYDAVVLDPLMRGVSADDMQKLLQMNIARVVYVGGNPHSFARDAKTLLANGYRIERVQPLDIAPHTHYADLVGLFRRD